MALKVLLVFLGGGLGSLARYLVGGAVMDASRGTFPLGTLVVNAVGCFAVGLLGAALIGPLAAREEWRLALIVGFLGGFTTFSAFGWETIALVNDGQFRAALLNILANTGLSLLAAFAGLRLGQKLVGA